MSDTIVNDSWPPVTVGRRIIANCIFVVRFGYHGKSSVNRRSEEPAMIVGLALQIKAYLGENIITR